MSAIQKTGERGALRLGRECGEYRVGRLGGAAFRMHLVAGRICQYSSFPSYVISASLNLIFSLILALNSE